MLKQPRVKGSPAILDEMVGRNAASSMESCSQRPFGSPLKTFFKDCTHKKITTVLTLRSWIGTKRPFIKGVICSICDFDWRYIPIKMGFFNSDQWPL
jgi:hypothetical protein